VSRKSKRVQQIGCKRRSKSRQKISRNKSKKQRGCGKKTKLDEEKARMHAITEKFLSQQYMSNNVGIVTDCPKGRKWSNENQGCILID
jgi:hypothetical protein